MSSRAARIRVQAPRGRRGPAKTRRLAASPMMAGRTRAGKTSARPNRADLGRCCEHSQGGSVRHNNGPNRLRAGWGRLFLFEFAADLVARRSEILPAPMKIEMSRVPAQVLLEVNIRRPSLDMDHYKHHCGLRRAAMGNTAAGVAPPPRRSRAQTPLGWKNETPRTNYSAHIPG